MTAPESYCHCDYLSFAAVAVTKNESFGQTNDSTRARWAATTVLNKDESVGGHGKYLSS